MSFSSYKNIRSVIKKFNLTYQENNYIIPQNLAISDYLRGEIEFSLREVVLENSELAICENLIYPILKEIWKNYYLEDYMLWSHEALEYDEDLSGVPDYTIAQRSPQGKVIFDRPYLVIVEAKKDNFTEGWGECAAEMVAAQKINESPEQTLFGIVSNGKIWEFGKLSLDRFVKNIKSYYISDLDELFGAINYLFDQCRLQLGNG
ncbi:hypothetical protein NJ959_28950 [Symplocastrum sp. BBK-W-15]|uniref:Uncharacterized protein n=1 Tax=Limnofasciculus baicalensis BBK-W-15 TaxID=2699891 RepID=A0AAE3KQG9_9CYAN|nr:hypothetical protein [Limnofasciculus baicalensis BBK-W-15]